LFYLFVVISLLTGHFRNLFYFTLIILVHELGHSLTGIFLKLNLKRIEIYPYGGCSKLEYDINTPLIKEFLVLIMGPVFQLLFLGLIYYIKIDVPNYFYTYNYFILIFNLLPIYPLDGGKLLHLLLCVLISYYNSLKNIIYFSYFIFILFFFYFLFFQKNLIIFLIFCLLGIQILKELKNTNYYFQKFLMERYTKNYNFSKTKQINNIKNMKRDYYHFFISNCKVIGEKEMLSSYFS